MNPADCPTLHNLDNASTAFLFETVDFGVEHVKQGEGPFIPFAATLGENGEKGIAKFIGDEDDDSWTQEDMVALGRRKLRELDDDPHCVALVHDGYFTGDGGRTEAVFVEAYELGRPAGVHLCQRYERRGGEIVLIGNPMLFDDAVEPLVPADRQRVEFPHLSSEAKRFALDVIGIGIECLEPEPAVMTPFAAVVGEDGSPEMWSLVDDEDGPTVGGGLDLGREQLAAVDRTAMFVALVWGGERLDGGEQEGAVFTEVYELGRPAGVQLVQQYRRIDHDRIALMGEPQVLDEAEPLVPPVEQPRSAAFARLQEMANQKRG
ncbi:hypothetical protein [Saccharopolyspora sp. NPDC002686]|uniref:hypothetical protein n=1 Tax=Saccharopolyspora sp. NPDC002686 TaxID=3154541 RepID=UPI00332E5E29